jgi:hypothetical protein
MSKSENTMIKCPDCPYWWAEDDGTLCCHYFRDDGYAPCEVDDRESENENV